MELVDISGTKRGNICKLKLRKLKLTKREERIPTRCNNINDLLSIPNVDY